MIDAPPLLVLAQAAPELAERLDRIVVAQIVTAIATAVVALFALAVAIMALATVLALRKALRAVERVADRTAARAEPIIDQAGKITRDLADMTATLRRDFDNVHEVVHDAGRQLRSAVEATDERIRRFGTVLRVVQEEMEEVLLDAASTARGLHTTAEALRTGRVERRERRPTTEAAPEEGDSRRRDEPQAAVRPGP